MYFTRLKPVWNLNFWDKIQGFFAKNILLYKYKTDMDGSRLNSSIDLKQKTNHSKAFLTKILMKTSLWAIFHPKIRNVSPFLKWLRIAYGTLSKNNFVIYVWRKWFHVHWYQICQNFVDICRINDKNVKKLRIR